MRVILPVSNIGRLMRANFKQSLNFSLFQADKKYGIFPEIEGE